MCLPGLQTLDRGEQAPRYLAGDLDLVEIMAEPGGAMAEVVRQGKVGLSARGAASNAWL